MKHVLMLICLLLSSLAFAGPPPPAPPKPAPVCVPKWECHCVGGGICGPGSIMLRCTDGCGHESIGGHASLMGTAPALAKGEKKRKPPAPAPRTPTAADCNITDSCRCDDPNWNGSSVCDRNPHVASLDAEPLFEHREGEPGTTILSDGTVQRCVWRKMRFGMACVPINASPNPKSCNDFQNGNG